MGCCVCTFARRFSEPLAGVPGAGPLLKALPNPDNLQRQPEMQHMIRDIINE